MNIRNLIRENLRDLEPYKPSLTPKQISVDIGIPVEKILKFDSGENKYVEKFKNRPLLTGLEFYTYPDPLANNLRLKLAEYTGMSSDWIMCGNGSDELIDLVIRIFAAKGDEIIISPPTFPMYECYARLQEARVIRVLRDENLYPDIPKIIQSISKKTKLIFIDSPGNPSSIVVKNEDFEKILKKDVIVVADEAYFEFSNQTVLSLLRKYPNLIVLRTFSKWAGLAGLRVGYMVANPEIINTINSVKAPYNVNSFAQEAACNVLDNRIILLAEINDLVSYRKPLISVLGQFPKLKVYPSKGAYILFKPVGSALDLQQFLRKKGFLIKLINYPKLENCLRMNLIKEKEAEILFKLLKEYYEI
jgi:histidinol-phosphate aminotransferase